MVENANGVGQFIYSPTGGQILAAVGSQALSAAIIPLPGGAFAVYHSSGLAQYNHPDWLGSARLFSSPSQAAIPAMAYAPFGEGYAGGQQYVQFTSAGNAWTVYDNENQTGSLEDFMFRRYNPTQGRWISPDPAGLGAVDPSNPQSWNRYAYVMNSPLNLVDPLGLVWPEACVQVNGGPQEYTWTWEDGGDGGGPAQNPGVGPPGGGGGGGTGVANNCTPLTPGCSNVPTAQQLKQFVQQQCLGQFNNSSLGGTVNFMSMASPAIGPNRLGSTIEDVGGTTLKYGVYQFFNTASQSMAGTPFGSISGIVAEGIETAAQDVVLPAAVGATGLQIIAHAGCGTVGAQAAGQMNPLPPGIQF